MFFIVTTLKHNFPALQLQFRSWAYQQSIIQVHLKNESWLKIMCRSWGKRDFLNRKGREDKDGVVLASLSTPARVGAATSHEMFCKQKHCCKSGTWYRMELYNFYIIKFSAFIRIVMYSYYDKIHNWITQLSQWS